MQDDLVCTSGSNGLAATKFFKHRDGKRSDGAFLPTLLALANEVSE
jgi:hypothetical protein